MPAPDMDEPEAVGSGGWPGGGPGFSAGADDLAHVGRRRRTLRVGGAVLGVLLVAAAVVIVVDDATTLRTAWRAARSAPWWMFAALLGLTLANWAMTSSVLFLLTRQQPSRERVPWWVMAALTGVSMPLSVLPLRPGLIGRVVYLREAYGVSVGSSVVVTLQSMVISVVAGGLLALGAWLGGLAGLIVAFVLFAGLARVVRLPWRRAGAERDLTLPVLLRSCEVVIWAYRYVLVFAIIERPIGLESAVLLAAAVQAVALVPITLGVREWSVGLLSVTTPAGLTADLLHRAVELAVALPVGGASALWLWRHARRRGVGEPAGGSAPGGGARVWRRERREV